VELFKKVKTLRRPKATENIPKETKGEVATTSETKSAYTKEEQQDEVVRGLTHALGSLTGGEGEADKQRCKHYKLANTILKKITDCYNSSLPPVRHLHTQRCSVFSTTQSLERICKVLPWKGVRDNFNLAAEHTITFSLLLNR